MEEEFIRNQEQLRPQEEKHEVIGNCFFQNIFKDGRYKFKNESTLSKLLEFRPIEEVHSRIFKYRIFF